MSQPKRHNLSVDRARPLDWRISEEKLEDYDRDDFLYSLLNPESEELTELIGCLGNRAKERFHKSAVDLKDRLDLLTGDSELERVRGYLDGSDVVRRAIPQDKYHGGELPPERYPAPITNRDIVVEIDELDLEAMYDAALDLQEEYKETGINPLFQNNEDKWRGSVVQITFKHGDTKMTENFHAEDDIYVIGAGTSTVHGDLFKIPGDAPPGHAFTEETVPTKRLQLFKNYQERT